MTRVALGIAILLVVVRATVTQTLRDAFEISPGMPPAPRGMGPGGAVILDLLLCVPALLVLLRAAVDRQFTIRFTWAHGAMFGLAGWIGISTFWAADRFAASIEATHWIAAMVLLWAVSQLVREWVHVRLIGGAFFGLLLVLVAHGLVYRFVDVPDERASFLQHEQEINTQNGWQADSFIARQFKKKVLAGEIIGFSVSPNTYAMELVLLGVIVAGMATQRLVDRDEWGWSATIIASFVPACLCLWLTQCRAAFVTPILGGGIVLLEATLSRKRRERGHRRWFCFITAGVGVIVGGVIAFGLSRGGLVHDSLTFRWRYWIGAMRIVREHLLRGVGFANFGDYYLAVRLPIASEEIRDPHNFFMRILSETGIIGAALLIAWLLRLGWEMTLPARSDVEARASRERASLLPLFGLASMAMIVNAAVSIDFSQSISFAFLEVLKRVLWAGLLGLGLAVGSVRSSEEQQFDDRPAPWIWWAMLASLAMFMLHNTIEFGWFESGPTGLFALLAGALMGISTAGKERRGNWAVFGAAMLAWVSTAATWTAPIVQGEILATAADDSLEANRLEEAVDSYRHAAAMLPVIDPQLLLKTATAQLYARHDPAEVTATLRGVVENDPIFIRGHLTLANLLLRSPEPDAVAIRREYEKAIALNPNDVTVRMEYGQALERLSEPAAAADELQRALDANAGLGPDEPKRLDLSQVADLSNRIRQLRAAAPPSLR